VPLQIVEPPMEESDAPPIKLDLWRFRLLAEPTYLQL